MRSSRLLGWIAASALLLAAPAASAVTLTVVGNGLTSTTQNYGCATGAALCGVARDVVLGAPADVSGTIEINALGTTATIVLDLAYARFDAGATPTVIFTDVTYTAVVPILSYGGSVFQSGVSTGSASGLANGNPFSVAPVVTNFTCASTVSPSQCSLAFGENGFTNVAGYDFVHTFNLNTAPIPEPFSALLVGVGVAGLLLRLRRV
jgi:hypothetical protein